MLTGLEEILILFFHFPDKIPLFAIYGFGVFHHIYNRILFNHWEHFRLSLTGYTVAFAVLCKSRYIGYSILLLFNIRCYRCRTRSAFFVSEYAIPRIIPIAPDQKLLARHERYLFR